jgi:hypothetical protein
VLGADYQRGYPGSGDAQGEQERADVAFLLGQRDARSEDRDIEAQQVLVRDQLYRAWNRYSSTAFA